ncbi:hypothetical protein J1N35_034585, partial [Gossypium stocksii]
MVEIRCKYGFPNRIDIGSDGRSGGLSLAWCSDCKTWCILVNAFHGREDGLMQITFGNGQNVGLLMKIV